MRLFSPLLSYVLFVILGTIFVIRGLVPALTQIDSDFPNYYTAARIVVEGKQVNTLYDDDWFQEQIRSYGMEQQGKFSPFPPATALVMLPVAGLDPIGALRVITVLNALLFVGLVVLLSRSLSLHLLDTFVFVLLTGHALINCFRLGQLYLLVSFLIAAGYYALINHSNKVRPNHLCSVFRVQARMETCLRRVGDDAVGCWGWDSRDGMGHSSRVSHVRAGRSSWLTPLIAESVQRNVSIVG
ncbi:MAG: hypothetical protein HW412_1417, partial [Bacteroidetes bacterium]|nr:hypothetical protein [Bacteroidota bacterium]